MESHYTLDSNGQFSQSLLVFGTVLVRCSTIFGPIENECENLIGHFVSFVCCFLCFNYTTDRQLVKLFVPRNQFFFPSIVFDVATMRSGDFTLGIANNQTPTHCVSSDFDNATTIAADFGCWEIAHNLFLSFVLTSYVCIVAENFDLSSPLI